MALCSLSTGRMATPLRRAASVTSAAGHDEHFLVRERDGLAASIAASTASSPSVPADAHSTMSTSGCVATATRPSAPGVTPAHRARIDTRREIDQRRVAGRQRDDARPIARDLLCETLGVVAGRKRQPPTAGRGCASTTASALWPIEPVDPRMAMRFTAGRLQGRNRTPARQTAARRCGRGRRRGRESRDELSFTPDARFSSDSNRSPQIPAATTSTPSSRAADGIDGVSNQAPARRP